MMKPTLSQTIRDVQRELDRHAQKQQVPRIVWTGLDEPSHAFAERMKAVRKNWKGRILAPVPHPYEVPPGIQAVPFPAKLFALLHPEVASRYRCGSGGRGSGKSWSFATAIILRMVVKKIRILAAREIMRSLRESVHHLLAETIETLGLSAFFEITDREIVCKITGSEVIFAGLWQNTTQLKSLEGVGLAFIEEAESVSQRSLEILLPTIRAAGSEIWLGLNPDAPDAPVMQFVNGSRPDVRHTHVIFSDNPFFPAELDGERTYLQRVDEDAYRHVWLGECRMHSDAQVFKGKFVIEAFEATALFCQGPYFGVDFGFSADPTCMIRCWVADRCLYIDYEAYARGCDIDRTATLFDAIPGARQHVSRADCSRPETISYMQRDGYPKMEAVEKWAGSVEDGIAHIRSYERVVIHPRCVHIIEEFRLYSYRVDKLTGDVLPDLLDKSNHTIDALRYAIQPLVKRQGQWFFGTLGGDFVELGK